jgi:cobaltochelatase CobN
VIGPHEKMLTMNGQVIADAVINTQIVLDPEGRRSELAKLGIPVMQALAYRKGDEAAWRADPQGLPLIDVPFYLSQGEYAGIIDPIVANTNRKSDGEIVVIAEQTAAIANKALKLVRLQRLANAEKKVAVFFWNYPPGEKNLSASYLNLPKSLEATLRSLKAAGYDARPESEIVLINSLQRLLAPFYRDGELKSLLADGLAEKLPVKTYRTWLATLPPAVQQELHERWGEPEKSAMAIREGGESYFVIPRFAAGKIIFTPQPPRGEKWEDKEKALYHSTKRRAVALLPGALPVGARGLQGSDALVHFGTHGTQEWLPGKERGLSVHDYPHARRRRRAGGLSLHRRQHRRSPASQAARPRRHRQPPDAALRPGRAARGAPVMHDLLHAWLAQDEGVVKEKLATDLLKAVKKERIERDMGWTRRARADFRAFVDALHNHLHELAETAQPLGLHTLGRRRGKASPRHRAADARPGLRKAPPALPASRKTPWTKCLWRLQPAQRVGPYQLLKNYECCGRGRKIDCTTRKTERRIKREARPGPKLVRRPFRRRRNAGPARRAGRPAPAHLLRRRPDQEPRRLPTGRNLYGFDPSRVPTQQAWAAGKEAAEQPDRRAHAAKTGKPPKKLAFSLWSVETMRHQGLLEAQALWLLGVEPVWDSGGRVIGVKLVPREHAGPAAGGRGAVGHRPVPRPLPQRHETTGPGGATGRPRQGEADNPVATPTPSASPPACAPRAGRTGSGAKKAAETRIFSSESGKYGTGLDDATLATDTWKGKAEGDRKLASSTCRKCSSPTAPTKRPGAARALGARARRPTRQPLRRTPQRHRGRGAVAHLQPLRHADHRRPLPVPRRHRPGRAPPGRQGAGALHQQPARAGGQPARWKAPAQFLAKELATRQFHPGYIKGLMAEGYAGTLQVLDATNNFWGWTAVAREIVRDDQWQEMVDVYVRDKHQLGLKNWFEAHNPHALAQTMERMLEAARQGYWQADAKTVAELKER